MDVLLSVSEPKRILGALVDVVLLSVSEINERCDRVKGHQLTNTKTLVD